VVEHTTSGTPQGGVISPLLANIYLHEVLDGWFVQQVQPRLKGRAFMVRYADDAVLVFSNETDARRVLDVLPKRFGKFGLKLHPDKTRLVNFKPSGTNTDDRGSIDLLGFTLYWGKSRKGNDVVQRRTAAKSFRRALTHVSEWWRKNMHMPVPFQHRQICQKLKGHYNYFGVTGNWKQLGRFLYEVRRIWYKALSRRTNQNSLTWKEFESLLTRFPLPAPTVTRSIYRRSANP
jgi:RNA-directed DNA polymerase